MVDLDLGTETKFCAGGGHTLSRRSIFHVQCANQNTALAHRTVRQFVSTQLHPLFGRGAVECCSSTRPATQLAHQTDAVGTIEIKPSPTRGLLSIHSAPPPRRPAPW